MKTPMLRSSLFAAIMLAFSGTTSAAGLGRISVFSALGQPLRAEVEIAATPEELDTMAARVATQDAFRNANIEYVGTLSGVKMSIEKRASGAVVKIASDKPFSEPFVDMLIELNWAGGRLLREYTFLLDPSETPGSKVVHDAAPAVARPTSSQQRRETAASAPRPSAPAAASSAGASEYAVKSGDTLGKIASQLKPVEITQDQMVAALYRANSSAFIGKNINRLRAGKILSVPAAADAQQIAPSEARKIIIQASNFEQYRQNVASAATSKETTEGQSSSGKIAPRVEETTAPQEAKDRVKVTATQVAKAGETAADAKSKATIQSLQDDLASRDKALKEANSRVTDLEKNVKELQKLIELKNQGLADAQAQAGAADAAAKEAKARAEELQKTKVAEATKPVEAAASPVAPAVPVVSSSPVPVAASAPAPVQSALPEVKGSAKPAPAVAAPAPVEEEGIFGNPLAWAGIVIAALGAAYVVIKQRRRTQVAATTQMTEASTTSQNSVFGSAGGQTVDTGGTSLLHTDFSQSGLSAIDTDEGVDPVAEADVYMAYGRDAQAEEILLDAQKNDPTRAAIYLKLLEIYAQRRSVKQFENVASDLFTQTGGVGDDWEKAAALGARIDPENALYRPASEKAKEIATVAGVAAAATAAQSVIPEAATADEDIAELPEANFDVPEALEMRETWTMPEAVAQLSATDEEPVPTLDAVPNDSEPTPESLNLDFNLDLELSDIEEQPTQMEPPRTSASLPSQNEAADEKKSEVAVDLHDTSGLMPLEFDLGLDEPQQEDVVADFPEIPPAAVAAGGLLSGESAFAPDADADVGIAMARQGTESIVDLEKTNFEGSLLDFDFELGDDAGKPTLDLSDVDLGTRTPMSIPSPAAALQADSGEDDVAVLDNIDLDEEISTKLELAQAYEEMGDIEGARELLEEVIADGAASQQETARAILARLG